jgi:hypothetical protein
MKLTNQTQGDTIDETEELEPDFLIKQLAYGPEIKSLKDVDFHQKIIRKNVLEVQRQYS